jgi:hypothetical protein
VDKRQSMQVASLTRGALMLQGLPDVPACAEVLRLCDEFQALVARLTDVHLEQVDARSGRGLTSRSIDGAVRTLRRRHLIPVSRRAKRLFKHDAGVLKALRVPARRATPLKHANAALAMAKALRPHVAFCHAERFRRGFLTELREAGKQLGKMAKQSDAARAAYSRATTRLRVDVRDAREQASIIDAELRALLLPGSGLTNRQRDEVGTRVYVWARAIKLRKNVGRPPKRNRRLSSRAESPGTT